jgi:hypothetical protein
MQVPEQAELKQSSPEIGERMEKRNEHVFYARDGVLKRVVMILR